MTKLRCSYPGSGVAAVLIILVFNGVSARAESSTPDWTLTTADLRAERVSLKSIDATGAQIASPGQSPRTIGFDQFLSIDRTAPPRVAPARLILCTSAGDRIGGEPVGLQGEDLHWKSTAFGEVAAPFRRVTAIVRPGVPSTPPPVATSPDAAPAPPPAEDVVQLANRDTVRGIISDVTPTAVMVQPASGGEAQAVPLDTILAAYFASTAASATAPGADQNARGFRVKLGDESSIAGREIAFDGHNIRLRLADDTTRQISISAVTSLEQVNGPVVWLSTLAPTENVQTPYFGQQSQPAQMDRTVSGEPIRFAGRTYARGIGVHAYSRLTFPLDPALSANGAVRAQYAIDGGTQAWADVTVRVKLDDKVASERANFKSGVLAPVVTVPLDGAKTLTLEVDYGDNYDVQDRVNWIEPALLREKPAPAPPVVATAPATAPSTQP